MFKKIIFGLMALMCLTACDEDYTDWKAPQGNPQEEAQNIMLNITPCADIDMSCSNSRQHRTGAVYN